MILIFEIEKEMEGENEKSEGKMKNKIPPFAISRLLTLLRKAYPGAACSLDYETPLQLLVATILSAQCTDVRVNMVAGPLFQRYKNAKDFAEADRTELETLIQSTGFYHSKAKSIQESCKILCEKYGGNVPADLDSLVQLPGVGRKTANVVLGNAFGIVAGVVVDTHVSRLARRIGLSTEKTPEKIEKDLVRLFPRKNWVELSHLLIQLGRNSCKSQKPDCPNCPLWELCPKIGVPTTGASSPKLHVDLGLANN